jgi:hypothetical protein
VRDDRAATRTSVTAVISLPARAAEFGSSMTDEACRAAGQRDSPGYRHAPRPEENIMADVHQSVPAVRRSPAHPAHLNSSKDVAWLGWVVFVGIMLFCSGVVNTVQGIVALVNDDFYQVAASGLAIDVNYTLWGWTLLVVGAILIAAGVGVVAGYPWARVVAVVVAAISALVNLGFAAAYPVWTLIAVGFDILAIYGLVVHGGAAKALRTSWRS